MLLGLTRFLDRCAELQGVLVQGELADWQRRQQRACIGAPGDVSLDQLDKWYGASSYLNPPLPLTLLFP